MSTDVSRQRDEATECRPGGPKGVPNKMSALLKDMILGALEEAGGEGGGQAYLVQQAKAQPVAFILGALDEAGGQTYLVGLAHKNPQAFAMLLAKVLPMQIARRPFAKIANSTTCGRRYSFPSARLGGLRFRSAGQQMN
jgi:hypothetical protein